MKKILFFSVFTIIIFISGCKSGNVSNESDKSFNTLKILKWGPDEGKVGIIPNKQPDGKNGSLD